MLEYGLIACFSRVIKVRSLTVRFNKNWELENGKKSRFWHSKKKLKLVILEKKSSGRRYRLCKISQHAEG